LRRPVRKAEECGVNIFEFLKNAQRYEEVVGREVQRIELALLKRVVDTRFSFFEDKYRPINRVPLPSQVQKVAAHSRPAYRRYLLADTANPSV
jgi:hypothetical protein